MNIYGVLLGSQAAGYWTNYIGHVFSFFCIVDELAGLGSRLKRVWRSEYMGRVISEYEF
jgi:hypothetical protein